MNEAVTIKSEYQKLVEPSMDMGIDLDVADQEQRQRVLVVDDSIETVFLLKQILRIAGFNVLSALNGKEAIKKVVDLQPNLVLLDIMMPDMDGWDTLEHLRQMGEIPVIIISALTRKEDVVRGLTSGADDYITKPFFNAEVTGRVNAVLRRSGRTQEVSRYVFPEIDLVVDLMKQEAVLQAQSIQLTSREFAILAILAKHAPAIVSYETIAQTVWDEDNDDVRKRIKYLVYLLRRKFEQAAPGSDLIMNVDRLGYKLNTEK